MVPTEYIYRILSNFPQTAAVTEKKNKLQKIVEWCSPLIKITIKKAFSKMIYQLKIRIS